MGIVDRTLVAEKRLDVPIEGRGAENRCVAVEGSIERRHDLLARDETARRLEPLEGARREPRGRALNPTIKTLRLERVSRE
jgi:hypothetical protein